VTSSAFSFDYNIDNIVVDAVPEPGTVVLVGIALAVATWAKIKNLQYAGRHENNGILTSQALYADCA
jgi:hypothetical protein